MVMPQQQTITTTVQSIGKPKSGKGWVLTVAHMWPGSKFPSVFYGQDDAQVVGLGAGDPIALLVQKGNLKPGKTPDKDFNFYWDTVSITKQANGRQATAPSATQPANAAPKTFPAPGAPYAPPAPQPQDVTRISIERQKAVAETVVLVVEAYKAWLTVGGDRDLATFLGEHVPVLVAQVRKSAALVYASIHGSKEAREIADPDAEGNERSNQE